VLYIDLSRERLEELYQPRTTTAAHDLAAVFEEAEAAFFANRQLRRGASDETPGQIHLTPLSGRRPGPPIYLRDGMAAPGRLDYCRRLQALLPHLDRLATQCRSGGRIARIKRCIRSVLGEQA